MTPNEIEQLLDLMAITPGCLAAVLGVHRETVAQWLDARSSPSSQHVKVMRSILELILDTERMPDDRLHSLYLDLADAKDQAGYWRMVIERDLAGVAA